MNLKAWQAIVFFAFALAGQAVMAASPSVDDIYQAAKAGRLNDAQRMVEQVVAEHPKSAKAHYVAAEIYAKEGQLATARNELQTAEQLEPGLSFAKPQSVAALKSAIAAPGAALAVPGAAHGAPAGFPWGTLLILVLAGAVVVMVIKSLASRNAVQQNYPANNGQGYPGGGYGAGGYGPAGGYPGPSGGGLGSSIVGGLATGAAVGAGIVAGEALAHHFLDGDKAQVADASSPVQNASYSQNSDMGGNDFGISNAGSWDDNTTYADSSDDVGGGDWG